MPELAKEVPTEEELRAYLGEHLAVSALACVRMSPEELARVLPHELAEAFAVLGRIGGPEFGEFALEVVLNGLRRLNRLPRSHLLWTNTNNRPTIYKLSGFCQLELDRNPSDLEMLRVEAILPVWFARNDFGQRSWGLLSRQNGFDLRWPLCAALVTHLTAQDTAGQTAEFIREIGAETAAAPILRRIASEGGGTAASWANSVLDRLAPPTTSPPF